MAGISGAGRTVDPSRPAAVGSFAPVERLQGSRGRAETPGWSASRRRRPQLDGKIRGRDAVRRWFGARSISI